jgi:hypothetical protein
MRKKTFDKKFMMKIFNWYIPKKASFVASKRLQKFKTQKTAKIVNYQNFQKVVLRQLEKVGGHRYPPGSEGAKIKYC